MRLFVRAGSTALNFSDLTWMSRDTKSKRQQKVKEKMLQQQQQEDTALPLSEVSDNDLVNDVLTGD
jgi:hypothetical protein